jgi:hypothetical protein
MRVIDHK